jgi:hydrogenase maturation protease
MKGQKEDKSILLVGLGNREQGDDGLGCTFVDMIDCLGYNFIDFELRKQLELGDAKLISEYDVVIFADASYEKLGGGFEINRCFAASHAFFSMNTQRPCAVLHLVNTVYKKYPKAYMLVITGEEWEERTLLSHKAETNLEAAVEFFDGQFLPSVLALTT